MMAGSFSLVEIVNAQAAYPFILVQPVGFAIFLISAMAESKRIPFDLPEAENELGRATTWSTAACASGCSSSASTCTCRSSARCWRSSFWAAGTGRWLPGPVWLLLKMMLVALVMIWIRGTLPRLRYDQLMALGWKVLMPAALVNIVLTGAIVCALRLEGEQPVEDPQDFKGSTPAVKPQKAGGTCPSRP
jgi:NADH-quinone oxidoreductase subunit H